MTPPNENRVLQKKCEHLWTAFRQLKVTVEWSSDDTGKMQSACSWKRGAATMISSTWHCCFVCRYSTRLAGLCDWRWTQLSHNILSTKKCVCLADIREIDPMHEHWTKIIDYIVRWCWVAGLLLTEQCPWSETAPLYMVVYGGGGMWLVHSSSSSSRLCAAGQTIIGIPTIFLVVLWSRQEEHLFADKSAKVRVLFKSSNRAVHGSYWKGCTRASSQSSSFITLLRYSFKFISWYPPKISDAACVALLLVVIGS
jgi:hypothetical protein